MKLNKGVVIFVLIIAMLGCKNTQVKNRSFDAKKLLKHSVLKVKEAADYLTATDSFPRHIPEGELKWECVGVRDWCSGFWPGVLWYAYEFSGDEEIKEQAQQFTAPLKEIAYTPALDHDIGFQMFPSYGNAYRLTGNDQYKEILLSAADTLATLYNPIVGSIHSWPMKPQYPHNTIIDNMMNLELLFWAAKNGGGKHLRDIAENHAEVTMKNIVRPDYSAYHLASFDDKTGAFIEGKAHQGYADNSMWARGQTWGIYGFAIAYRETGRKDFLETSMKMADKFIERLPEDGIPFWDFDDPAIPNTPKDASAAAVAACGMFELYELLNDQASKQKYYDEAVELLKRLSTDDYLSADANVAILEHSVGHMPKKWEIDVPIIYADYYYLEALLRLKKLQDKV
ncbi:glycoside hydrolase family 88 protein [Saccharicrinis sp. 156]|uniref:glycoside hydrolase family 88 protein n=1 Tax=Saccharicrinis sp. 156 TaxID=3417574 RepID=UPI003D32863B